MTKKPWNISSILHPYLILIIYDLIAIVLALMKGFGLVSLSWVWIMCPMFVSTMVMIAVNLTEMFSDKEGE